VYRRVAESGWCGGLTYATMRARLLTSALQQRAVPSGGVLPRHRAATTASLALCRSPLPLLTLAGRSASLSTAAEEPVQKLRNIGISAHIDSGKTTLTERILYFTGRIGAIHEVRGKDGVGAKMDSMELEREKGITIQSAATHCQWGEHEINIIDTPGHVDFTIEVERALRVLDGAILVLCGVAGVQSQSITVDRQMKRYSVPRIAFINKLDREGADPDVVVEALRTKLNLNAAATQLPIGLAKDHEGVVDVVAMEAHYFEGPNGEEPVVREVPEGMVEEAQACRALMLERLADVDEEIADYFLSEEEPPLDVLRGAIRRQTIALSFVPVFMGSAFKNKGVHPLLDGVAHYLPAPTEVTNHALDLKRDEAQVELSGKPRDPLVGLAFKLEEGRFGQLTYMRIYQGSLNRGDTVVSMASGDKVRVPKLVRMHSNDMEEVESCSAGDIVAMFGVDTTSGTTFTDGSVRQSMTSMFVPEPVVSLALTPKDRNSSNFGKALGRFTKEDPTFRVHTDPESGETIISGMGELHLEIYVERMMREYKVECTTGAPKVAIRETCSQRAPFAYTHKKQSGGSGQYGKVEGYLEPLDAEVVGATGVEFRSELMGNNIPPDFIPAIEKGFNEAFAAGHLCGAPVMGVRVVLKDGAAHAVDSNELSFRAAAMGAFKQAMSQAKPLILEPVMSVEVSVPSEFQGATVAQLSQRKGTVNSMDDSNEYATIDADVPLQNMFGYSSDLRSATQGKGEFSMEYKMHMPVTRDKQEELMKQFQERQSKKGKGGAD
jgi:elongation factor G